MLSNAYFLAKFRFDTAENEPAQKLQNKQTQVPDFALKDYVCDTGHRGTRSCQVVTLRGPAVRVVDRFGVVRDAVVGVPHDMEV